MRRRSACGSLVFALFACIAHPAASQQPPGRPHFDQTPPASADPATYSKDVQLGYARVRAATAPFQKLEAAVAAGYAPTVEMCYDDSTHGAMGYHHVNRGNAERLFDLEHPQILMYERRADGSYALNGVEFLVPYRLWPADSTPPRIMGQVMIKSDDLKLWYRHMWAWSKNRAGLFANWNPDVACRRPPA